MGHYYHNKKILQQFDPGFGAASDWKSDFSENLFYMIQYVGHDIYADIYERLSLLADWYAQYCMDVTFNIPYETILCYEVTESVYWYSNVYWGFIR